MIFNKVNIFFFDNWRVTYICVLRKSLLNNFYIVVRYSGMMKFQVYFTGGIYVTVVGFALSELTCSFRTSAEMSH